MSEWKYELQARLRGLQLTPEREAEIIEELSVHLDDRHRELIAGGMSEVEARRQAVDDLEDHDLLSRGLRALRQAHAADPIVPGSPPRRRWLGDIWQDVRYGVRMLRKQPGFAAAAIGTLALGIGANTAIFSLVDAMLFQRLPVRESSSLAYVFNGQSVASVFAYPEYAELRDRNEVFEGLLGWGGITASLNADGATDLVTGAIVTGNFFEILGVRPLAGRLLATDDDLTPGAHPVAVISHGLWQRRFGGRADIAGQRILLNGQPFTVVGVTPAGFGGPQLGVRRDLYVPMMMQAIMRPPRAGYSGEMNPDLLRNRGNRWVFAMGRLKPGGTTERVEASLTTLIRALDEAGGRTAPAGAPPRVITAWPVDNDMPGQRAQIIPVATLLMCIVGAVLLIACANVANLLLSRAASRRRELAVRLAIGANRWRLVRQLLTESVLLAMAGGAAGIAIAFGILSAVRAFPPPPGPWPTDIPAGIDARVLGFSLALSLVTGLLFGLAPAFRASRAGLVPALKDGSASPDDRSRRFNLRKALVVLEVALSLALLVSAGLFVRSLRHAQGTELGLDVDKLVTTSLNINLLRYTTDQGRQFYTDVVARMTALPGVESATVSRMAPLASGSGRTANLDIEGREGSTNQLQSEGGFRADGRSTVNINVVGPAYFQTMGIRLRGGRDFNDGDRPGGPRVAIVTDAFVATHFPNESAVGRRLRLGGQGAPWREIVGVVANSIYSSVGETPAPIVFLPLTQNHETGVTLFVRTAASPETIIPAMRREIQALEPNLPVPTIQPFSGVIGTSLYPARMVAWLVGVFGGLALILAAVGVYGVLAFSISRRTRELGIRVALGARAAEIFSLVVREGMWLVAIGVGLGLAGAAAGARVLARFLYTASGMDVAAFLGAPLVLGLVALAACLIPARRAMRVNPTEALKSS